MSTIEKPSIIIRNVERFSEFRAIEELEKEVWGVDDRDVVPFHQLVAVREVGGQLIGAFDGDTLVGFAYGFVGLEHGNIIHHSHMLAVKPAYRNLDLGYKLKLAQRERVLGQGITRMTWTFDPLQSLNAHFNFSKLGAVGDDYKINFYGEEASSFLHQNGTDRLRVSWLLESSRVVRRLQTKGDRDRHAAIDAEAVPLVQVGARNRPLRNEGVADLICEQAFAPPRQVVVEIPADLNLMRSENQKLATEWREATRWAFSKAMAEKLFAAEFYLTVRQAQRIGVYLLRSGKASDLSER